MTELADKVEKFKTPYKTINYTDGKSRALQLVRVIRSHFTTEPDAAAVNAFFDCIAGIQCAWKFKRYNDGYMPSAKREKAKNIWHNMMNIEHKELNDVVEVYIGDIDYNVTLYFPIGTGTFYLDLMPDLTLEEHYNKHYCVDTSTIKITGRFRAKSDSDGYEI